MAKREARTIFDLPEEEGPEEITPLRAQELAISEAVKKTVKLPGRNKRNRDKMDATKPVSAFVEELIKDL